MFLYIMNLCIKSAVGTEKAIAKQRTYSLKTYSSSRPLPSSKLVQQSVDKGFNVLKQQPETKRKKTILQMLCCGSTTVATERTTQALRGAGYLINISILISVQIYSSFNSCCYRRHRQHTPR